MSETVLVTGAAGFIGAHASVALLRSGRSVVGLDNFDPFYDRSIKEAGVARLRREPEFRLVEGDVRDAASVAKVLDGVDVVVHLAARTGVRQSLETPAEYASVNVEGTARLLEGCRRVGVRRFVFGSSSSVYGESTPVPFREDAPATRPISPYAATKRAGELLCEVYGMTHGMRIAIARFFTVYGPRQRPDLAIHTFARLLNAGQPISQYGNGSAERDHTYVDDIVDGVLRAIAWTRASEPSCEAFNLGRAQPVRLDRLIELIATGLGVRPDIHVVAPQAGDVVRTCADISKSRRILGYSPAVGIEAGIPLFLDWFEAAYGRQSRAAS